MTLDDLNSAGAEVIGGSITFRGKVAGRMTISGPLLDPDMEAEIFEALGGAQVLEPAPRQARSRKNQDVLPDAP